MKFLTSLTILSASLLAHGAMAANAPLATQIKPAPRGGLQIQFQTSAVQVVLPPLVAPAVTSKPAKAPGVAVSALVINQSNRDIEIGFTSAEAAHRHVVF